MNKPSFYEFFAGGGMARAGLGDGWNCLFANDFDAKKAESYRANWGGEELFVGDVRKIETQQLPGRADLIWASFPCQDLSLAGGGAGLKGERSGTFWPFWDIVKKLRKEERHPPLLVLENVCGALTSHGGKDFTSICDALAKEGYRFGALVIDAALFVPQSRPRLFIVAVSEDVIVPSSLERRRRSRLSTRARYKRRMSAYRSAFATAGFGGDLPTPPTRATTPCADLIEEKPTDVDWHSRAETQALIDKMSDLNLAKVEEAKQAGRKMVGTLYRRTRYHNGKKIQRAEARFDNMSGCLRTPAGGSSRQFVLVIETKRLRSRLISARETARTHGASR